MPFAWEMTFPSALMQLSHTMHRRLILAGPGLPQQVVQIPHGPYVVPEGRAGRAEVRRELGIPEDAAGHHRQLVATGCLGWGGSVNIGTWSCCGEKVGDSVGQANDEVASQ